MPQNESAVRIQDGAADFSYGVDSSRVTTVRSETTPQGLPRNSLAWLDNGTVRGGGIQQRNGWLKLFRVLAAGNGAYQGGYIYNPLNNSGLPYLILSIGGVIYQCLLDGSETVTNLSEKFNLYNPAGPPQVWMEQGEEFLVIQAGDYYTAAVPTLPLFWDGATLRRSNGLISAPAPSGSINLTTTAGWVIPPVGGSVVVSLNAAYTGSVGDTQTWPGGLGTFTVSAISGSTITLVTVSSPFATATVTPGTYAVAVTQKASAIYNVTTTNNFTWYAGSRFEAVLNAGTPYGGSVGDSVFWVGFGQLTVVGISASKLTVVFQINSTSVVTDPITAGNYVWVASPASLPPANVLNAVTTTGTVNFGPQYSTFQVVLNAAYGGPATIGDILYWTSSTTDIGQFVILAISADKKTLTLQLIANPGALASAGAATYSFTEVVPNNTPVATLTSELPAATCMKYYDGIMWYAFGSKYIGGDIVLSASGTTQYGFRDAILKVTQNQLAVNGLGFSVPANAGVITALFYTANLNTTTGTGPLYIGTRLGVWQLNVPLSLTDWTNANNANQPTQTTAQFKYGPVSDRCVALAQGDAFYQTLEPAIRSFQIAQRYFGQWANVPISNNENRVLRFNNRALMATACGIEFNNRLLQAILPTVTPVGVAFQGIAPLDFDLISTLQEQRPPAWEGMQEGLNVLQLFEGDFGGLQRAFIINWSDPSLPGGDGSIGVWEMTGDSAPSERDNVDSRVTWYFETPAWTFSDEFALKQLDWMQMWVDRVAGQVDMKWEYRVDADNCWRFWAQTSFCSARNSCEDAVNPVCYPIQPYCEGQKFPIGLPAPPVPTCVTGNQRPCNIGFQFQIRVTIKGWCRVRGLLVRALPKNQETFANIIC